MQKVEEKALDAEGRGKGSQCRSEGRGKGSQCIR